MQHSLIRYGVYWETKLPGLSQLDEFHQNLTIEMEAFSLTSDGRTWEGALHAGKHLENIMRLLWPSTVRFEGKSPLTGETYENTYSQDICELLGESNRALIVGPGSSNKTFVVCAYALVAFYCNPKQTSVIVTTTTGRGADMRAWAAIKELHEAARFSVGKVIEHLKVITFDEAAELNSKKKDASQRILKNGIFLMPLPEGEEGLRAAKSIVGIKQSKGTIILIVDEAPMIAEGAIELPLTNLQLGALRFQAILTGNAIPGDNPHRKKALPASGTFKDFVGEPRRSGYRWVSGEFWDCLQLDGHKSPNCLDPALRHVKSKRDLPLPYLANWIDHDVNARALGKGNLALGREHVQYLIMNRGHWPNLEDGSRPVVLTDEQVPELAKEMATWNPDGWRWMCSADPAFTREGDKFALAWGKFGIPYKDYDPVLEVYEVEEVEVPAHLDWSTNIGKIVAKKLFERGVLDTDFAFDQHGDAAPVIRDIVREWSLLTGRPMHNYVAISSNGKPTDRTVSEWNQKKSNEAYDRLITELWFSASEAIQNAAVRAYKLSEAYHKDFVSREYVDRGTTKSLEVKKYFKERHRRSPNSGDALVYLIELARRHGLKLGSKRNAAPELPKINSFDDLMRQLSGQPPSRREDDELAPSYDLVC